MLGVVWLALLGLDSVNLSLKVGRQVGPVKLAPVPAHHLTQITVHLFFFVIFSVSVVDRHSFDADPVPSLSFPHVRKLEIL